METGLVNAKYVFLDVVDYSLNRHSEAQVDIINAVNDIVRLSIQENQMGKESIVILPTGDGMCIGLINIDSEKYDLNLILAIDILKRLHDYNQNQSDELRQFQVRIGLNENVDNLIIDINGVNNLSGSGITLCQRVMNLADGGNVLVSQQVYEVLSKREKYFTSFSPLKEISIKHGRIKVFQYVDEDIVYLNDKTPSTFIVPEKPEPRIPEITATYLALLKRDQDKIFYLQSKEGGDIDSCVLNVAYWYEAHDILGRMHETRSSKYYPISPTDSLDELIVLIKDIPFRIRSEFTLLIRKSPDFNDWIYKCAESTDCIYLTDYGESKIKNDWPEMVEYILINESA